MNYNNLIFLIISVIPNTYSKYAHYPEYCSRMEGIGKRTIPDVSSLQFNYTKLLQVNTIIRHGSRTPSKRLSCWDGYSDDVGSWDCDLKTVLAHPIHYHKDDSSETYEPLAQILFEKDYNALEFPLENKLKGTCELGQLIVSGYNQLKRIGTLLRGAYMSPRTKPRLDLFSDIDRNKSCMEPYTYFRSDDKQRTIMSGQALFHSFFGNNNLCGKINVHLADLKTDILKPNPNVCPALNDIHAEAVSSSDFQKYQNSPEVKKLISTFNLINGNKKHIMDCLGTTICNDRSLPSIINDFDGIESKNATSVFAQLMNYATWQKFYLYSYQNALFSKLSMGPLWHEISRNIEMAKKGAARSHHFVLYSGHGDTIMPFLATLGSNFSKTMKYAPYATMLILEIHVVSKDETFTDDKFYAFRLIYNGKVLTHLVPGCPQNDAEQLCHLKVLFSLIKPFANLNCTTTFTDLTSSIEAAKPISFPLISSQNRRKDIYRIIFLVFLSALGGSLLTYIYLIYIRNKLFYKYDAANSTENTADQTVTPPKSIFDKLRKRKDSVDFADSSNNRKIPDIISV